jgi:two-component system, OmpR family, sensor kinase
MKIDEIFLGRVGHDLRGELATMIAGIHYLVRYEAGLTPSARQMLDRVNGAGQRLRRLLDEFDHAAWVGGGDPAAMMLSTCDAAVIVERTIERSKGQIEASGVELRVDVPADLPRFEADGELCSVALEHVLDFAIARSTRGLVVVRADAALGVPVLRVSDQGGAAEEGVLSRLLDPFVEKDVVPRGQAGAQRRERLGLGLSIAQGILTAQGGGIRAEATADGAGITLVCRLAGERVT